MLSDVDYIITAISTPQTDDENEKAHENQITGMNVPFCAAGVL